MESGHETRHIVAIPYPARGHINPMMALCHLLAARDVHVTVTVVVTDEWRQLLTSGEPTSHLRLHAIPNVLPSEKTRGNDYRAFTDAVFSKMEGPVEAAIEGIDPPVEAVITDSLLLWGAAIAGRRNVPVWWLWTHSTTVFRALHEFDKLDKAGRLPTDIPAKGDDPLAYLPRPFIPRSADITTNTSNIVSFQNFVSLFSWFPRAQGLIFTSVYELESQAIDTLQSEIQVPFYTFGPPIPYMSHHDDFEATRPDYIKWLDSQPVSSVLYISLGSFLPISGLQIEELGIGLHESGVRFLWISRGEPEYTKHTSRSAGQVVSWCDQLRVLSHPSVGGFLTHCGWNSTLEGVFTGVPMLTFPLIWDQYPNAKSVVDDWKVGLRLKDEGEEERIVGQEKIVRMVKKLMALDDEESEGLRKRSAELKSKCQKALEEHGSSTANLDALFQEIIGKKSSRSDI
nr:UDP-glycosyltransferase [Paris polyphylla]